MKKPADRVHPEPAGFVLAAVHPAGEADRVRALALVGELCRVVQNQDDAVARGTAAVRRLEMASEDLRFADPVIGEEAVGRLGVGPVLARQRKALLHRALHPFKQLAEALPQALVRKVASGQLVIQPGACSSVHGHLTFGRFGARQGIMLDSGGATRQHGRPKDVGN